MLLILDLKYEYSDIQLAFSSQTLLLSFFPVFTKQSKILVTKVI